MAGRRRCSRSPRPRRGARRSGFRCTDHRATRSRAEARIRAPLRGRFPPRTRTVATCRRRTSRSSCRRRRRSRTTEGGTPGRAPRNSRDHLRRCRRRRHSCRSRRPGAGRGCRSHRRRWRSARRNSRRRCRRPKTFPGRRGRAVAGPPIRSSFHSRWHRQSRRPTSRRYFPAPPRGSSRSRRGRQ